MRRKTILALAGLATISIAAAPATTDPSSEAGATAAEVEGVATVSETNASTEGDGSADATVVGAGDEQVVGGAQEGTGESGGEVVTTGEDNEDGYATVGGWDATVEEDSSSSSAAVAEGNLGGEEGASASVLSSESNAREDGSDATTTGAVIDLGGGQLHLELLKSTTSSDKGGESYVLEINGEKVLTSEQADGQCDIAADPVAHLLCLYATATEGEDGSGGNVSGVLDASALDDNLTGGLFTATAGDAPAADEPAGDVSDDADEKAPAGDGDVLAAPASSDSLPRTGGGLLTGVAGLLTLGAGLGLRRFSKS